MDRRLFLAAAVLASTRYCNRHRANCAAHACARDDRGGGG